MIPWIEQIKSISARLTGSQDELDDESVQGKHQQFDSFSIFSSEWKSKCYMLNAIIEI